MADERGIAPLARVAPADDETRDAPHSLADVDANDARPLASRPAPPRAPRVRALPRRLLAPRVVATIGSRRDARRRTPRDAPTPPSPPRAAATSSPSSPSSRRPRRPPEAHRARSRRTPPPPRRSSRSAPARPTRRSPPRSPPPPRCPRLRPVVIRLARERTPSASSSIRTSPPRGSSSNRLRTGRRRRRASASAPGRRRPSSSRTRLDAVRVDDRDRPDTRPSIRPGHPARPHDPPRLPQRGEQLRGVRARGHRPPPGAVRREQRHRRGRRRGGPDVAAVACAVHDCTPTASPSTATSSGRWAPSSSSAATWRGAGRTAC